MAAVLSHRANIRFALLFSTIVLCAATANSTISAHAQEVVTPSEESALTGTEIKEAFSGVQDSAVVQDRLKTKAQNIWFADGRFISKWKNSEKSGEVTGQWSVRENLRCVVIASAGQLMKDSEILLKSFTIRRKILKSFTL